MVSNIYYYTLSQQNHLHQDCKEYILLMYLWLNDVCEWTCSNVKEQSTTQSSDIHIHVSTTIDNHLCRDHACIILIEFHPCWLNAVIQHNYYMKRQCHTKKQLLDNKYTIVIYCCIIHNEQQSLACIYSVIGYGLLNQHTQFNDL